MKVIQVNSTEWNVKDGRRIKYRVWRMRDGKFHGMHKCGLGIAQASTLEECLERTIAQDARNRADFKNRLVSLS
jgi:ribosomal protein S5